MKCSRPNCTNLERRRGLCNKHAEHTVVRRGRLVPADRTRAHIAELQAAGVTYQLIGEIAGRHRTWVCDVLRREQVTEATERRVLAIAIPSDPHRLIEAGYVPAAGSIRRLRGLVACGHTQRELANEIGWQETNLGTLIHGQRQFVSAATARLIADLSDRLHAVPGTSDRARRHAAALGWVATLAWDEDQLDNPHAQPDTGITSMRPAFVDRYLDVLAAGETHTEAIAKRMGITPKSLERMRERHGLVRAS